jgi:hypothetical protein
MDGIYYSIGLWILSTFQQKKNVFCCLQKFTLIQLLKIRISEKVTIMTNAEENEYMRRTEKRMQFCDGK